MPEELAGPEEGVVEGGGCGPGAAGRMRKSCKQVQSCGEAGR